jgi:hypothetical protein
LNGADDPQPISPGARVEVLAEWLSQHMVRPPLVWDRQGKSAKDAYRKMARSAIAAMDAANESKEGAT